jgi:hypothetical protein
MTVLIIKGVRESTLSVGKSVLIKVVLIKVKIKKKKPTQLSNTPTIAVVAVQITPHSITPKSTHHTRRDGARRANDLVA